MKSARTWFKDLYLFFKFFYIVLIEILQTALLKSVCAYKRMKKPLRDSDLAWNSPQTHCCCLMHLIVKAWVSYSEWRTARTEIPSLIDFRIVFLSIILCTCLLPSSILTHLGFSKREKNNLKICSTLFRAGSKQVIMKAGDETAVVRDTSY